VAALGNRPPVAELPRRRHAKPQGQQQHCFLMSARGRVLRCLRQKRPAYMQDDVCATRDIVTGTVVRNRRP
jgi:hypothetical protein